MPYTKRLGRATAALESIHDSYTIFHQALNLKPSYNNTEAWLEKKASVQKLDWLHHKID